MASWTENWSASSFIWRASTPTYISCRGGGRWLHSLLDTDVCRRLNCSLGHSGTQKAETHQLLFECQVSLCFQILYVSFIVS
jgi:hypothetical protein